MAVADTSSASGSVLAQSAVAQTVTGTTSETTLATVTIPAGMMGANGSVVIYTTWSYTNSANTKTLRAKFGSTNFMVLAPTTTATYQAYTEISNRNAINSQVGMASGAGSAFGTSTGAPVTATLDTTTDQSVTITAQLSLGTETITLERYRVAVIPKP